MIAIPPVRSSAMMFSWNYCPLGLFWVFSDSNKGATMTPLEPTSPSGENLLLDDDDVILLTDEILLTEDDDIILLTDEILPAEDNDIIELHEIVGLSDTQQVMKSPAPATDKTGLFDLSDVLEESDLKTEHLPDLFITEAETLNLDFDRISDPFQLEPKMPVEDTVPLDVLHRNESDEIIEFASYKDSDTGDGLILLQDVAPSTPENEFVEPLKLTIEPAQASTLSSEGESKAPATEFLVDDLQQLINEVVHDSQVPHQDLPGIHSESNKPTEKDAAAYNDMLVLQPMDQIDAAMERVIRNLCAERIGLILDEVVTTTVTKEIENLKKIFLNYLISGQSADKNKS
jgi:hypothetical protein